MVWTRAYNDAGQKVRHVPGNEDRTLKYRDWTRTFKNFNGYLVDADNIKWRTIDGLITPVVITELTRFDGEGIVSRGYLDAIIKRFFFTEKQGATIQRLADYLGVPAYLVLFQINLEWLYVYSFRKKQWKLFQPKEWELFLRAL